jgi:hypothetical protein
MRHVKFSITLGCIALLAGCAPTLLQEGNLTAVKPLLNGADYGEVQLVSQGETLGVKLMLPPADVCQGAFKLTEMKKSYPPIYGTKMLVYSGQWNAGQTSKCIEALGGPGGPVREISIAEEDITGYRTMSICNDDPGKLLCTGGRTYRIAKKS